MPVIFEKGKGYGGVLHYSEDKDKKGEKWYRIEATLEPLFRLANFIFNSKEQDNEHAKRLAAQFIAAKVTSKQLDGPDAVQGAVAQIQKRIAVIDSGDISVHKRTRNMSKSY
jgi:hypothetical protein